LASFTAVHKISTRSEVLRTLDWPQAPIASEAYDPSRTLGLSGFDHPGAQLGPTRSETRAYQINVGF